MSSFPFLFNRAGRLTRWITPVMLQAFLLFGVDMLTNIIDYGYHIYLGSALEPGGFAIVQTMNSVLLIVATAFAAMQPAVARYVAEKSDSSEESGRNAVFQAFFRQSGLLGILLFLLVLLARNQLASWLNVPVAAVAIFAPVIFFALVRPVTFGMLQGRQQFVGFGISRTAFALGRLTTAIVLIGLLGGRAIAGVATMSVSAIMALGVALIILGPGVWQRTSKLPLDFVLKGWRLSLAAFLAYTAYIVLLNADLIWVNRTFAPELAGSYAVAVVFRRVIAVLPAAVLVILYPRIVRRVSQGFLPDMQLIKASIVIVFVSLILTVVYFLFGDQLVQFVFGVSYPNSGSLLGWMAVAMIGYGLVSIWLNLYLATRPWPFVVVLSAASALQWILLARGNSSLIEVTADFVLTGWLLAIFGLLLYIMWLRPQLDRTNSS